MAEEYKSVHTGPDIDAAVTRALPGGAISQAINAKPNRNLLDNAYFGNPVNQRGQTEYTGAVYGIDRWKSTNTSAGVVLQNGSLTLSAAGSTAYLNQHLENSAQYYGKTLTVSILSASGELATVSGVIPVAAVTANTYVFGANAENVTVGVWKYPDGSIVVALRVASGDSGSILACKLELGSEQTLAHQENGVWVLNEIPNYAEELAKCQRYFRRISGNTCVFGTGYYQTANHAYIVAPLGTPMRVDASSSSGTISLHGTARIMSTKGIGSSSLSSTALGDASYRKGNTSVFLVFSGLTDGAVGQGCAVQFRDVESYIDIDCNL